MEIRRVQTDRGCILCGDTPKGLGTEMRIKKNDPVGLIVQPDGTLVVTKQITEEPLQRIKEIDIGHITDPAFLFRMLIGAYITGFTVIRITTKTRFPRLSAR